MQKYALRPLRSQDCDWVAALIKEHWGSETVVVHQTVYHPARLPGFVAFDEQDMLGLITYNIEDSECEVVTLTSLRPSIGIGTALIEAVIQAARQANCRRLWLITTNDNLNALGFYQKRGFALAAIYPDAIAASREIKPEIPLIGNQGIPIRDEIELELLLHAEDSQ